MTKPARVEDLSYHLDSDLVWRVREFSDLKASIVSANLGAKEALLRALAAMLYAHWEGYVKNCVTKYFQHVALRRKTFEELEDQLYINAFLARLDAFFKSKGNLEEKCRFVRDIIDSRQNRFSYINPALVDTKSNLDSAVLKDLCRICGVSYDGFIDYETFIDQIMLKRRNAIAHGQIADIQVSEMDHLVAQTTDLMRQFKTLVENKAYQTAYLAN